MKLAYSCQELSETRSVQAAFAFQGTVFSSQKRFDRYFAYGPRRGRLVEKADLWRVGNLWSTRCTLVFNFCPLRSRNQRNSVLVEDVHHVGLFSGSKSLTVCNECEEHARKAVVDRMSRWSDVRTSSAMHRLTPPCNVFCLRVPEAVFRSSPGTEQAEVLSCRS